MRRFEKIGYGLGDAACSMLWKLFSVYLMFFYTDICGLDAWVVGILFLVTRVWDSLLDPFVGLMCDRTRSRRGTFRPWLLWGALPFGLLGILTFSMPAWGANREKLSLSKDLASNIAALIMAAYLFLSKFCRNPAARQNARAFFYRLHQTRCFMRAFGTFCYACESRGRRILWPATGFSPRLRTKRVSSWPKMRWQEYMAPKEEQGEKPSSAWQTPGGQTSSRIS